MTPSPFADVGMQGDLNLNIAEAHAFNTTDRFSLDVFVVTGWNGQVCRACRAHVPRMISCCLRMT